MKHIKTLIILFLLFAATAFIVKKEYSWRIMETEGELTARHGNSFVECNGKFYLLGGRGIKPVDIFDPVNNMWTKGAEPPVEIHHFQAVSYRGKIIAGGALTGPYPDETPLPNLYVYDPEYDLWTLGPVIPAGRRRGSSGAIVHEDKIYMICGIIDGHNGNHVNWLDAYDFQTRTWSVLPSAPRPRDHFHAILAEDKIYAFAGRTTSKNTDQVFDLTIPQIDVYDLKSNSWSTLQKEIHIPRAGASVALLKNEVFIIGGESMFDKTAHNEIEIWNLKQERWMPIKYLVRGRHGTQAVVYKNKIYIAAGSGNRGGSPELNSIEVFSKNY
ncbi:MAG: galactose oxidase [Cytophagales bacterium]|nr:galactose oxidase [Cytophagales bacterium]